MSERPPNLHEKFAAALLQLLDAQGNGIPFAEAQLLSPHEIIGLFQCHHEVKRANGGGNHPTNLTMMLYREHRTRTAKIDVPEIRKGRRLARGHQAHIAAVRSKILAVPDTRPDKPRTRWPKGRKIQNGQKLQSRSSFR
jgi:hypothetical protein